MSLNVLFNYFDDYSFVKHFDIHYFNFDSQHYLIDLIYAIVIRKKLLHT